MARKPRGRVPEPVIEADEVETPPTVEEPTPPSPYLYPRWRHYVRDDQVTPREETDLVR